MATSSRVHLKEAVSVVIPTRGRPSLQAALESALSQGVEVEVLLVADLPEHSNELVDRLAQEFASVVRVIWTGGGRGGAYARSIGTDSASCPWVAYLDDDDVWLANKLATQLRAARDLELTQTPVLACRVSSRDLRSDHTTGPIPHQAYSGDTSLARWFFYRRRLSADRNLIPTSTLLLPATLAKSVQWRVDLARHQDWDFLLRLTADDEVVLIQLPEVLVEISVGASGSVTEQADWKPSLSWAQSMKHEWDRQTYTDFVVGQPLRYALQTRSFAGTRAALKELPWSQLPSLRAIALAASGILSRATFGSLLHARRPTKRLSDTSNRSSETPPSIARDSNTQS